MAAQVASEQARIGQEQGIRLAPEARQRVLDDKTLIYYYDGAYLEYWRRLQGI